MIPKQLQNPNLKFVLLGKWNVWKNQETGEDFNAIENPTIEYYEQLKDKKKLVPLGKAPFEKDWQKKGYKFTDRKLLDHIQKGFNFGVIGGHGSLRILDIDDKQLAKEFLAKITTYTVKTGGGGMHFYFFSDYDKNHVLAKELGELRAKNYQVVSAPCRHPSGNYYKVLNDVSIKEVSQEELSKLIKPYLRKEKSYEPEPEGKERPIDTSRSGLEYRKVVSMLLKGKSKEEIFKEMMAYSKWAIQGAKNPQYREITYNKAKDYVKKIKEEEKPLDEKRKEIKLPKTGKLISDYAKEVANVLNKENILFFRTDSRDIVEIGKIKEKIKDKKERIYIGFIPVKPSRFITLVERFFIPGIVVLAGTKEEPEFEFKPKSMTADLSNTVLQSYILEDSLLNIDRIFTVPIPIIYNKELTFPKAGYDERFKSWLPYNSPKIINTEMTLEEAKNVLYEILKEFCFQSEKDYTIAIAGLITPSLRGLYKKFNARTPVLFYLGNRERVGKDYLAGINGIIYEGVALQEPPICKPGNKGNSDDELRKKLLSAFLSGRKRLHFSNNKGYLNNAVFEAIITAETYSDRLLGKNETPIFDNELEFSLSGNVGIGFTPDLAYRSRFVRLFLDIEDANARNFKRPNLHQWVLENRELILSAIYALIRNWFKKDCPDGKVAFASFSEWARVCGGVMETAGYDSPCKPDEESLAFGGDSETTNMKSLFEVCYEKMPDKPLTKKEIRDLIEGEDIFAFFDFEKRSDQVKFGNKIIKFIGRVLSDIRMKVIDSSVRSSRQKYIFIKEKGETDKSKIFGDIYNKDGNLGNLGNILPLKEGKLNKKEHIVGESLPALPTLPKNSKKREKTPTFPMENKQKKYKNYGEVDFEDHEIEQAEERYDKTNKELDTPLNE